MSKEPLYPHVPKKKEPLYPHRASNPGEGEIPKWFIDRAIEEASTYKKRCAVRYYTEGLFLPMEPTEVRLEFPGGAKSITATESFKYVPTREYWRVWREYDNLPEAMRDALDWLKTELSNYYVGESYKHAKPRWQPVQIICEGKVLKQWNTVEDGERELGMTKEEAYKELER